MGNRWNTIGHIAGGIAASLIPGLHFFWAKREIDQCPMENDQYPVINFDMAELMEENEDDWYGPVVEYWAAPRVMDSLNDTREIAIGAEIGRLIAWGIVAYLLFKF